MGTKQTPGEHWDGEQVARDTPGAPPDDTDAMDRTDVADEPAVGGLSGGGQPSGESHWQRVEDKPDR
jgi:hypothetical protein